MSLVTWTCSFVLIIKANQLVLNGHLLDHILDALQHACRHKTPQAAAIYLLDRSDQPQQCRGPAAHLGNAAAET